MSDDATPQRTAEELSQYLLEHAATQGTCPHCASARVRWRVHRLGGHNEPGTERELAWLCRDCEAEWSEPAGSRSLPA